MFQEDLHGVWNQTAVRVPRRSAFILGGDEKAGAALEVLALPLALAACFWSLERWKWCCSLFFKQTEQYSRDRAVSQVTTGGPK